MKQLLFLCLAFAGTAHAQSRDAAPITAAAAIARQGVATAYLPTGTLEIYTYGLADFGAERSRARVARRWGFSYRSIAGCIVSQELLDTADRHNGAVEAALAQKHGADWEARFETEVADAMWLDSVISAAALRNPTLADAQKHLDAEGKGLMFEPGERRADGRYDVYAYAYEPWEGEPAYVTHYTLAVDTAAGRAEVVNNNRWLLRKLQ